jgi:hypothetical protein
MSQIMQLIAPLRFCLLLALLTGSPSLLAQGGRADAGAAAAREAIHARLQSSSIYERRKALEELLSVAPDDPETVEVLIRLFHSRDAEEARYSDFMQRVGRALQSLASRTTWSSRNVELLTSVLVHNDAYDSRATSRTASTVAEVARYQAFSLKAIDDLTTVLWHRVDKNPNRTRSDNTRSYVVQALRHIRTRQGLPQAIIDTAVVSLGSERNASVRRETVLLIDDYARSQPAGEAMMRALTEALNSDQSAAVRTLAARSLRNIGEQRKYPQSILKVLQRAVAGDPDLAVRREALAGLMAAATVQSPSQEALPPEGMEQLLQAASGDPSAQVRFQVLQSLRKIYGTRAPDPRALEVLLARLGKERDPKVRGLIAVTLQEIHARQAFDPAVIEPLIPLITDDPAAQVRQAIGRMLIEPPVGRDLAAWVKSTGRMGLSLADAVTTVAVVDRPPHKDSVEQATLRARLLEHYVSALSEGRPRAVRAEILQGLFALSLIEPLPQQIVDLLARRLVSDPDAGLRLQVVAVLLHNGLQHRRDTAPFFPALNDGEARVHDYAAFAIVELVAVGGDVLPGLLRYARDPSAHRHLRAYSLRRLALWRRAGGTLPQSVQDALLALTAEPDVALRAEAWNALRQFKAGAEEWRRAAADDDLGIRRMAWRELEARGVAKPLWDKWRDPKQRLQLIAVGLLGATVLSVAAGAASFLWRLLLWWRGTRQRWGRMLAAQLLWLVAALATITLDASIVFAVALSHSGISEKDLTQLNIIFSVILALYVVIACLAWKLLPARSMRSA